MKAVGIVREVDQLGRIVIPKELRKVYKMEPGMSVEIFTNDDSVVLKTYEPGCIFCGEVEGVTEFKGKKICPRCREEMQQIPR